MVTALLLLSALSLLVAGQVAATRADLQGLRMHRQFVEHAALADGAIRMVTLALLNTPPPLRAPEWQITLEDRLLSVQAIPASAFIDLNNAPPALLQDLLVFAGGLPADVAQARTEAILLWRDPEAAQFGDVIATRSPTGALRLGGFEAVEDLMQVQGIDLGLYDRIVGLVTVHNPIDGVDPRFAPPDVLEVLTRGDRLRARHLASSREADDPTLDIADLPHAWLAQSGMLVYRITASRQVDDATLVRTRWIALERGFDGTPWRELSTEPVRRLPVDATPPATSSSDLQ